jgi:hypothetical protein
MSVRPEERYPDLEALLRALTRAAGRGRRLRWALAVGVLGVVAAASLGWALAASHACEGGAAAWASRVTPAAEARLSAWPEVSARLERYRARWVQTHAEVCQATWVRRTQAEPLLGQRMQCLERRLVETAVLLDELGSHAALDAPRTEALVGRLRAPEDCARIEPAGSQALPAVEADELALMHVVAAVELGDAVKARGLLTPLLQARPRLTDERLLSVALEAEVELDELGGDQQLRSRDEFETARTLALEEAIAEGRDDVAFLSRLYLAETAQLGRGAQAAADRALRQAEGFLRRLGRGTQAEFEFHVTRGRIMVDRGALDEARADAAMARELASRVGGPDQALLPATLEAEVAFFSGDFQRSEAALEVAIPLSRRFQGEDSPATLNLLHEQAVLLIRRRAYAEADQALAEAYERRGAGVDQALALADLALSALERLELDRALALATRAVSVADAAGAQNYAALARERLALAQFLTGAPKLAEPTLRQALVDVRESLGPESPDMARALREWAELEAALGKSAEATRALVEARRLHLLPSTGEDVAPVVDAALLAAVAGEGPPLEQRQAELDRDFPAAVVARQRVHRALAQAQWARGSTELAATTARAALALHPWDGWEAAQLSRLVGLAQRRRGAEKEARETAAAFYEAFPAARALRGPVWDDLAGLEGPPKK